MSNQIVHVTDATFEAEVFAIFTTRFVGLLGTMVRPLQMIAPILDQLADEWAGKIKIAKMNVDDNQAIPAQFGIRSIPTLVVLKDGQVLATRPGALAKPQLEAFVNASLAG